MPALSAWLQQLLSVVVQILDLLWQLLAFLRPLAPLALWFLFCLRAINWKRMTPTLKEGAWVPALLLVVLAALAWSQAVPSQVTLFGFLNLPNFWWQLGTVGLIACLGLFAGWVQNRYGWTPVEVPVEPPVHGHGLGHEHH